jgi:hypothetical protein
MSHARSHVHEIGERGSPHLLHRSQAVYFHGDLANIEIVRYLPIGVTTDDPRHHLPLARSQGFVAVTQSFPARLLIQESTAAPDRTPNCFEQLFWTERLRQELHGACLHRPNGYPNVTVTRNENDRQMRRIYDALLQLQPVEIRQAHVEHETARHSVPRMPQKLFSGGEDLGSPARARNERAQRFAHGDVVIDDEDDRHRRRRGT